MNYYNQKLKGREETAVLNFWLVIAGLSLCGIGMLAQAIGWYKTIFICAVVSFAVLGWSFCRVSARADKRSEEFYKWYIRRRGLN